MSFSTGTPRTSWNEGTFYSKCVHILLLTVRIGVNSTPSKTSSPYLKTEKIYLRVSLCTVFCSPTKDSGATSS